MSDTIAVPQPLHACCVATLGGGALETEEAGELEPQPASVMAPRAHIIQAARVRRRVRVARAMLMAACLCVR